jgi:phytoene desaturase
MADYDVIVIGGGIGGLAAGGLMARDGRKTLVLEQNKRIGGFCSTFEHRGYRFDLGASIVELADVYERFFRLMGTSLAEEVDLLPLDPIYTYLLADGTEIRYPALTEAVAEEFMKISPRDARSWLAYAEDMRGFIDIAVSTLFFTPVLSFKDLVKMFADNPKVLKYLPLFVNSYQTVMEKYFKDPRILEALCFQANYTGLPPALAPGITAMLPFCEHTGFYYCKGGMIAVPEAIRRIGQKAGMELKTGQRVTKIMVKDKRACGVVLSDGTEITADVVISDISAKTLYMDLIGLSHLGPMARAGVRSLEISVSGLMMYLGLAGRPNLASHHTIASVPVQDLNDLYLKTYAGGRLPKEQLGLISWKTYSDPGLAPNGRHTVVLTICGTYHLDGMDWDEIKKPLTDQYVDYFSQRYIPGMKDQVEVAMLGTPKDYERDLLAPEGGAYTFSQDSTHSTVFRPAAKSKSIDGLYLVGASTHPGGGVPAAIASAVITARLIDGHEWKRWGPARARSCLSESPFFRAG